MGVLEVVGEKGIRNNADSAGRTVMPKTDIEVIEKELGHATGIGAITRGECPRHCFSKGACMFCLYGHFLDCHYPKSCMEANCSHYRADLLRKDGRCVVETTEDKQIKVRTYPRRVKDNG